MWPARHPPRGRQVAEIFVGEGAQVGRNSPSHHLALPQLDAPDLAARRLRKLWDELDVAGMLVRGGLGLAEVLYLPRQLVGRLAVLGHDDIGLDDAAAVLIRGRNHRALDDGRVLYEDAFDLEGTDAVAGGEDHIVRPA